MVTGTGAAPAAAAMPPAVRLRDAAEADVPTLLALIRALAEYERLAEHAVATPELLRRHLFGPQPRARAVLAEAGEGGEAAGFALYFFAFSTFTGRPSLYLEDLFVRPERRGSGVGRALLSELARRAVAADCARMDWAALRWNEPALGFYRALGAGTLDDWTRLRLEGEALARLAAVTSPASVTI